MITAKDFWNNACRTDELKSPADIIIEFTKMHVEMAKKEANEKAKNCHIDELINNEVLNTYPLENIK